MAMFSCESYMSRIEDKKLFYHSEAAREKPFSVSFISVEDSENPTSISLITSYNKLKLFFIKGLFFAKN